MGSKIISAKGKTHYGIATCVCYLADAILNQRPTIVPICSTLKGEYGVKGIALNLPSIIGVNGVERRLVEKWSKDEINLFHQAADKLQASIMELRLS